MSEDMQFHLSPGAMEGLTTDENGKLQVAPVREPEFLKDAEAANRESFPEPQPDPVQDDQSEVEDEVAALLTILAQHDDKLAQLDRDIASVQQGMTLVLAKMNEFLESQQPKPQPAIY